MTLPRPRMTERILLMSGAALRIEPARPMLLRESVERQSAAETCVEACRLSAEPIASRRTDRAAAIAAVILLAVGLLGACRPNPNPTPTPSPNPSDNPIPAPSPTPTPKPESAPPGTSQAQIVT